MKLDDFQDIVMGFVYVESELPNFIYPAIGLAGETGEVMEEIKKSIREGLTIPKNRRENIKKELGDVLFYVAMLAESLDLSLEEIANENIRKLTERHGPPKPKR